MDFEEIINSEKQNLIGSLQGLMRIKSVYDTPKLSMPYGEGINNALLYMENIASQMGFVTRNIYGHVLEVEYGEGTQKGYIVTHLDVVPEGAGWTYPAFDATIIGDRIYGRGAIDNKGPAISMLYALKAIKDSKIKLDTRVRLIFGTAEETTMNDLKYYVEKEGLPDWGLSPDNIYPIVNGEFGIMFINFNRVIKDQLILNNGIELIDLKGGIAANSVPDYCIVTLRVNEDMLSYFKERLDKFIMNGKHSMKLETNGEICTIECFGVACHGGSPENGVNAVLPLIDFLYGIASKNNSLKDFLGFINNNVGYEINGKKMSIYTEDSSGNTVVNVGICSINSLRAECTINIRFPVMTKGAAMLQILEKKTKEYNIDMDIIMNSDSHYVDENSDFIKKLQNIYSKITGKDAKPISLKGGTYARMLGDKGVAFGPCEAGSQHCGNGHKADEFVDINLLITNAVIYANTILELCKS